MSDVKPDELVPAGEIEKRKKRLDALIKGDFKPRLRNYRYVVNFSLPPLVENVNYGTPYRAPALVLTRSFTVAKGTIFDVRAIEQSHTIVGTLTSTQKQANLTVPPTAASPFVTWVWKRYDSGSGREMQNDWLPSSLLMSENRNGFWYGDPERSGGRDFLSGGSEVVVTMGVIEVVNFPGLAGYATVSGHDVQIGFSGVEVIL